MKVKDIVKYLEEKSGYAKEGKTRLCHHLRSHGYKTNEYDCSIALRVFNNPDKYQLELGNRKFKRLFFDIETSPNLGSFWQPGRKVSLNYDNIEREAAIISISWKLEGKDKVHHLHWKNDHFLEWDDREMLEKFIEVVKEVDEVCAHNGDRFDIKWLRTRCLKHGLKFPAFIKTLDTLPKAKYYFRFPSNRLNDIGRYLGIGEKMETNYDLWRDVCFKNDKEALEYMIKYNDQDVVLLEDIYHYIKSYIDSNTHEGVYQGKAKWTCPICGSENVQYLKPSVSKSGTIQRIMECNDCGNTYKISNSDYRKFINVT